MYEKAWDYTDLDIHCVKSIQIQSFSAPQFPTFGLNTERFRISPYSVRMWENTDLEKLCIWTLFTQWYGTNTSYNSCFIHLVAF